MLFKGRHDLPKNKGAIFSAFDFSTFKGVKNNKVYTAFIDAVINKGAFLLVTGLTPALTEILAEITRKVVLELEQYGYSNAKLTLLHYDKNKSCYIEQVYIDYN